VSEGGSSDADRGDAAKRRRLACFTGVHAAEFRERVDGGHFFWVDLEAPSEGELDKLGDVFGFHPLAMEDAKAVGQRPKLDHYGDHVFLVFYGARPQPRPRRQQPFSAGEASLLSEVDMFISGSYVITIHADPMPELDELRGRVDDQQLRSEQFLIYKVIDAVTDTFFPVLAEIDEQIDTLEDEIISDPGAAQLQKTFALKRELVSLRRVVTPQRDLFARSMDDVRELPGLEADEHEYFRDIYDHLIRISDLVDSYRDLLSGATDLYLTTVANRQGEVSKQLTIIATIFLPLTFLTGFFGQNFSFLVRNITGSAAFYEYGLGSLVASCIVLLVFFRRKGWV
jgi:magnesium transporter